MKMKMLNMKKTLTILMILLLLLLIFITPAWAQDHNSQVSLLENKVLFGQANHLYEKGEFAKAVDTYHQLIATGYESGNLYLNLGNSYYKMGQKGSAILYYEKAQRLIPGDRALKTNLTQALIGVDEGEINWSYEFIRWLTFLAPLDQLTLASSACFYLFLLLVILLVLIPARFTDKNSGKIKSWYRCILISSCCLLLISITLTTLAYLDQHQAKAVAIKGGAPVLSEPASGGTVYYHLAEGSRVLLNATNGDWYLIKRQDGKRGWVEKQYLGRI
jgi:tetratricopeptide (TPR) repeat protein